MIEITKKIAERINKTFGKFTMNRLILKDVILQTTRERSKHSFYSWLFGEWKHVGEIR